MPLGASLSTMPLGASLSTAPRLSAFALTLAHLLGRPGVTTLRCDGGAIYRKQKRLQLFVVAALLILALLSTETPAHQAASAIGGRITVTRAERRGRFFRTRVQCDTTAITTYQGCRLLICCRDVEVNPGPARHAPDDTRSTKPGGALRPKELRVSPQNARSLASKLEDLRAAARELLNRDLIAITETWLNDTVLDSELSAGLPDRDHTCLRRDRGSLGGG